MSQQPGAQGHIAPKASAVTVPLTTDSVAPCRVIYGDLSLTGDDEYDPGRTDVALFFEVADTREIGRVTFEDFDSLRVCRGETLPYDVGHEYGDWVYIVHDSPWLAERHEYEWTRYEMPMLDTHDHYVFQFHDQFVEVIAAGIWLDLAPSPDPFRLGPGHPLGPGQTTEAVREGMTAGITWHLRGTAQTDDQLIAASELCSQALYEFTLGSASDRFDWTCKVRTRNGRTRSRLGRWWGRQVILEVDGIPSLDDVLPYWERYCHEVAERRQQMRKDRG